MCREMQLSWFRAATMQESGRKMCFLRGANCPPFASSNIASPWPQAAYSRNRCCKCDAATTEWCGWQQGCPARFQGCPAGSPALPPRQPCVAAGLPAGQPCADSRQPCAAILAALRCHPGSPARQQRCHPAALRGSPARQPWWQQGCHAGSPARHRQPCAAAPGVAYFARFGAGRVPRPFTLRTLKTVKRTRGCEGPEQVLRCRRRHAPG